MTPIQLWLPTFSGGIARPELQRDMKRMFRERTTEHLMWSVPGWTGPSSWTQDGLRVSCLNGETWECVRILHFGEKGGMVGPAAAAFPRASVAGMLDHWLNDKFVRADSLNPDEPLHIKVPRPVNGGVALVEAEMTIPGESYFPIKDVRDERVAAQWPPRSDMPTTVSPEMESAAALPHARKTLRLRFAWLAPFDKLQPLVISPDDLHARDRMRLIAERSDGACDKALVQARTEARDWVSEGQASVNEAWLQPIIAAEGEDGALFAIEAKFGISEGSLDQAYKNNRLRRHLSAPLAIRRAWGVPGLMWVLLLDRLSMTQPFRACKRCGKLISGRRHKLYCSAEDNLDCYQAGKRGDKRRSRARGSTRR
jgi:hypothetical protein